ncbi:MAG: hypothetical protein OXB95_02435 [Rhodobacteraceae bacterium]|nr:hypothetical protein [Paracoccaceae bacterium]
MIDVRRMAALLAAAVGLTVAANGSIAAESGSFSMMAVLNASYESLQQNDVTAFAGPVAGPVAITKSTGDPFSVGSKGEVQCLAYGKLTANGISVEAVCSYSSDQGDLHMANKRTGTTGTITLLGGTGSYEGISGACEYTPILVSTTASATPVDCTWER